MIESIRSPGHARLMAAGVVLAAAAAAFFFIDPATSPLSPPCPVNALTGFFCPGCGSLRALHALVHLDLSRALDFNPLLVVSIPVLALMTARPRWFQRPWVAWASLAVLLLYGLLRNVPAWPFTWLAP